MAGGRVRGLAAMLVRPCQAGVAGLQLGDVVAVMAEELQQGVVADEMSGADDAEDGLAFVVGCVELLEPAAIAGLQHAFLQGVVAFEA